MKISVSHNLDEAIKDLTSFERLTVPIAGAKALSHAAFEGRAAVQAEMRRVFDRPTPFVLGTVAYEKAAVDKLESRVYLRDMADIRKRVADQSGSLISHQIEGGTRARKGLEFWLTRSGLISRADYLVPTAAMAKDSYGNVPASTVARIISHLRAYNASGFTANVTDSKRSTRKRRAGQYLWIGRGNDTGTRPGIWFKSPTQFFCAYVLTRAPRYKVRLRFFETAQLAMSKAFRNRFGALIQAQRGKS